MTREIQHLPALRRLDPRSSIAAAVTTPGLDTSFFVSDAIRQAVSLAAEMMRPSVRKLAERLESGPIDVNGWTFHRVKTKNQYDLAFVAQNPYLPGGYLYNVRVQREFTTEAKQRRDEIENGMLAHLNGIVDPADWMSAFVKAQLDRPPELIALEADTASYRAPLDCQAERMLAAWAFNDGRGFQPETLGDNSSSSLDQLLSGDLDGSDYNGRAFNAPRSDDLEDMDSNPYPDLKEAEVGTGRFAAVEAMLLLDEALTEVGLHDEVAARMEKFADIEFRNYHSGGYEIPSVIGFGGVFRDGGRMSLGAVGLISDLWEERTCCALDRHAASFVELVRNLAQNGHVSEDSEFDCHDLNDWAHVEETNDRTGVVWLRSTGTQIAMEYELDEEGERLVALRLAEMKSTDVSKIPTDPADAGFLGTFVLAEAGYVAESMGVLCAFNFVALEKTLGSFPSISRALDDEYSTVGRPAV